MGSLTESAAVTGQFAEQELYNNSTTGAWLYVYGLTFAPDANSQATFEWYYGKKATTTTGCSQNPLALDGPVLDGITGAFSSAVCIGNHIGMIGGQVGGHDWPYPYPAVAIPPGYAVSMENQQTNMHCRGAFLWLVDVGP